MAPPGAGYNGAMEGLPEEVLEFHRRAVVADMHAHPSLKTYLAGERFHRRHRPGKDMGVFTMQVCLPSLRKGGVDVQVSTVHVPEKGLADDCLVLEGLSKVHRRFRRGFRDIAATTHRVLDRFEAAVARAAREAGGPVPRIARSPEELQAALAAGDIAILHAIEGGHSLEGDIANLDAFHARGVCMLTLAHFYPNGVAAPVDGIPHDFFLRKLGCFRREKDLSQGLTDFGRDVVERMVEKGMLVDLTHCTPRARQEVFAINRGRRPLVFSHVGLHALAPYDINPTDDEVRRIADTGGMVGVILMPYYLSAPKQQKGFDPLIETFRRLIDLGGEDCAGIGSDFDGFTDPPDDLREPADYSRLTARLLDAFGSRIAEKILGANFLRVLHDGWQR
jgi:membrane dipeptidase